MSLPTFSIVCSRCTFKCPDDYPSTQFRVWVYDLDGGAVAPVMHNKAWCPTCKGVVHAETVPTAAEIDAALAEYRHDLDSAARLASAPRDETTAAAQLAAAWAARRPDRIDAANKYREFQHDLWRRFIASEPTWRQWAANALGRAGRCLACHGPVQPLVWVSEPPATAARDAGDGQQFRPPETPAPNYVHPGCGGTLTRFDEQFRVAWRSPEQPQVIQIPCSFYPQHVRNLL